MRGIEKASIVLSWGLQLFAGIFLFYGLVYLGSGPSYQGKQLLAPFFVVLGLLLVVASVGMLWFALRDVHRPEVRVPGVYVIHRTVEEPRQEVPRVRRTMTEPPRIVDEELVAPPREDVSLYRVNTRLLREIFDYLRSFGTDESLCYTYGTISEDNGSLVIPTSIIKIEMDSQSPGFVSGSPMSVVEEFSLLQDYGSTITLLCHIHPGRGVGSTHPSNIDLRHHQGMERFYPAIGAIFSRDGYVRFFSCIRRFRVQLDGKGVTQVEPNVFRIRKI